jgi:hypothetical protein
MARLPLAPACKPSPVHWAYVLRTLRAAKLAAKLISGVIATPRKTNYDFERREREKARAADAAKKTEAKAQKKAFEQVASDLVQPT